MMKKIMMNIKWDNIVCHICDSKLPPQPIKSKGTPLTDGQFGYAAHPVICGCGFVFLNPRWSKEDYTVFYENYYDDLYRLEIKPDYGISGVIKNMKMIWDRIKGHVKGRVDNILDVGCGCGYGLKFLKDQIPNASLYGIESSPECCKTLQDKEIGATLVTTDFDSAWTKEYENKMDLIILRHVIEHMLDPVESLKKLKTVLTENGLIYFATPDMMHPRTILRDYDNWWEYWFRAVHPYYYSKDTLFKTLEMGGLFPYAYGEEYEEVWCLATLNKTVDFKWKSVYQEQMEILNKYLP
jgi:SAM-dependent methyltransferase